mmetsp:Transcript_1836/g.3207  ORF Transcript_1836/g.3207 Transcript_1836/m.3207 type:complete len:383 (+) Transcript_1836:66-1214(+)|eukprot:CAMPEP_0169143350 /NCGR_PEP_ID=MMETSP1015-20121227/45538_1 /TAXON_ID=342587 /ORGANISM="Karlodinium micrum, Strain CCMP2283" /LENGTH=382 /DNA_ID=CAMNT_0009210281 /DNA_START=57 /DNA_END=1205 /DNA_ORIENTATION=-
MVAEAGAHENALDQHVVYFLRKHPDFYHRHTISRIQPGRYQLDGREIGVEWHYGQSGEEGYLVAVDGPLRQPFADYVQGTEANACFDDQRLPLSSLQQIPKERQLSFGDMHQVVSRLEAMKIAKEQALVREMAAEYTKDGQIVPQSALMERYQKTIDKKLGNQSRRQTKPAPVAEPPVAVPVSKNVEPPAHRQSASGQQNMNLNPIFCPNHDSTEKRKKTASRKVQCPTCGEEIQTNYAEFSVCHACSQREKKCLCCGIHVGGEQKSQAQCAPAFCAKHAEKREKTQPRNVQCTSCHVTIQTNYKDFALCAPCSQAERRCVCCGAGTTVQSAPLPSQAAGFPQLQGLQMLPNQAASRFPSQCALQPNALVAHGPMASHYMFA